MTLILLSHDAVIGLTHEGICWFRPSQEQDDSPSEIRRISSDQVDGLIKENFLVRRWRRGQRIFVKGAPAVVEKSTHRTGMTKIRFESGELDYARPMEITE